MPTLSAERAQVVLTGASGATVAIDYRPGMLTPRRLRSLPPDELLAATIIAWDLLSDAGQPIPATLDGVRSIGERAQALILAALLEGRQA